MKLAILQAALFASVGLLAFDDWRLRRRLRYDRLAREAEQMLGGGTLVVDGVMMPDPDDHRWVEKEALFDAAGKSVKRHVLALGKISVTDAGQVFIGDGAPTENSGDYGKRVIRAYKQRIVNESTGLS